MDFDDIKTLNNYIDSYSFEKFSAEGLDLFLSQLNNYLNKHFRLSYEQKGKILDLANRFVSKMFTEIHLIEDKAKASLIQEIHTTSAQFQNGTN